MRYTVKHKTPTTRETHLPAELRLCQKLVWGPFKQPGLLTSLDSNSALCRSTVSPKWNGRTIEHPNKTYGYLFEVTSCYIPAMQHYTSHRVYVTHFTHFVTLHIFWTWCLLQINCVCSYVRCYYVLWLVHTLCSVTLCSSKRLNTQSAGPVHVLIYWSISIFLPARRQVGDPSVVLVQTSRECMYSIRPIHWNINLLQPAQAEVMCPSPPRKDHSDNAGSIRYLMRTCSWL